MAVKATEVVSADETVSSMVKVSANAVAKVIVELSVALAVLIALLAL